MASEIELIRELGRVEQTLVTIVEAHHTPTLERGDAERLRSSLADFHQMDPGAVAKLLRGARTRAPVERAIDVEFSYPRPGFVESGGLRRD